MKVKIKLFNFDKRTIGEAYSSAGNSTFKNRFEGKGVGPDGKYLLFWE